MKRSTRYLLVFCVLLSALPVLAARSLQSPQAVIVNPQQNATVRGVVAVRGTATTPGFQFYKVEWGRGASPSEWRIIGETRPTQVTDGVLVQWDTIALPDGVYTLRLQVVKNDGNYLEFYVRQIVIANKRPTDTPVVTAAPDVTATPTAPLQAGPTVTLVVLQPTAALAQPTPTPTPVRPLRGTALSLPQLPVGLWREAFCMGAGSMVAIFLVLGVVFALRRLL